MPRDLREAGHRLIGRVYVHPVSQVLVVFTEVDRTGDFYDPLLVWRAVSSSSRGRTYTSTVLKDDGRWVEFRTNRSNELLPYSYRS